MQDEIETSKQNSRYCIVEISELNVENQTFKQKRRFDVVDESTKQTLLENRKALNTNRATKQWILCLNDFLKERSLPEVDSIDLDKLPELMGDFYFSAHKKCISEEGIAEKNSDTSKYRLTHYKNSSLRSRRAALNWYFKGKFGLDIISNEKFIKANEIFQAVTK